MSARRAFGAAAIVTLIAYLMTGLVVIPQDEIGVVSRFGATLREPLTPGLNWNLPWGADRVVRISKERVRTLAVGSATGENGEEDFLTGDDNLVTAAAQVHYRIEDARQFFYGSRSADETLAALAQSALVRALAARRVNDVLTGGRGEIADQVRCEIQQRAEKQGLGVSIHAVHLTRVAPPAAVASAFAEVTRARSVQRKAITRAEQYRDSALAEARSLSREVADKAAARADLLVQSSRGEAARFTRLLHEGGGKPSARRRMYLDMLSQLLPRFARTYIVAPGQGVELRLDTDR